MSQNNIVVETGKRNIVLAIVFSIGILLTMTSILLLLLPRVENDTITIKQKKHPNVVLIIMDAFRADKIGAERNGVPLTPFLNRLTHESAYFTNAVAPCTWTRPSVTSLFTALHVDTHQVYYGISSDKEELRFSDVLPEGLQTIATYLQEIGYSTHAVQTNGQLSADFGYNRGFNTYKFLDAPPGEEATANALSLIAGITYPFFLYVHYMDPHIPYDPPQYYLDLLGYNVDLLADKEQSIAGNFGEYFWDHLNYITGRSTERKFEVLSPEAKDCVIARYDAEIRYCDDQVRSLVTSIKKEYPGTIFIVTADHGEHWWDHDYLGHGLTMYNCELRVPLFIVADSLAPAVIEKPVSLIGVLPTISALLGTEPSSKWQGESFFEKAEEDKPVFSYSRSISPGWNTDIEAVIFEDMKYIRNNKKETEELYKWLDDSLEKENLVNKMPDRAARMQQILVDHRHYNINARHSVRQQTNIDTETIEQLRGLGYME